MKRQNTDLLGIFRNRLLVYCWLVCCFGIFFSGNKHELISEIVFSPGVSHYSVVYLPLQMGDKQFLNLGSGLEGQDS